ncbi:MAG: hemolysin family protein [Clostridiales bacterium]|nr:hemolysin family protein [Clostridiales bacterium]
MPEPDGNSTHLIVIIGICLILSALFSAALASFQSINKLRLHGLAEAGVRGAARVEKLTLDSHKLLSAVFIGKELCTVAVGALLLRLFFEGGAAFGAVTAVAAVLLLFFTGITLKTYAAKNAEQLSVLIMPVMQLFLVILMPAAALFNALSGLIVKTPGADKTETYPMITENELKTMVDFSDDEGMLEDAEKKIIQNVFEFGDNTAADVMTPRTEIVSLPSDADYQQVMALFKKEYFSRIPVYKDDMDHIIGVLHLKDFIFCDKTEEEFDLPALMRAPFFSYESKPTTKLFAEMRTDGIAMAIILDEYGGTLGLLSIQDLIEEIVGDISDEYDKDEIVSVREDEYIVDGGTKIEDFNEMAGTNLKSEDYESLGGFVIELLGAIPESGAAIVYEDEKELLHIHFAIEEMDKNRIVKIRTTIFREKEETSGTVQQGKSQYSVS